MIIENCEERISSKSLYCIKNSILFCFLGGLINMQSLPDHPPGWACTALRPYATFTHTLQKVVTHSWIKVSKLQNCFYYNITQKHNHQNKSFSVSTRSCSFFTWHSFVQNESKWHTQHDVVPMVFTSQYKTSAPLAIFSQLQEASCSECLHDLKPCIHKCI